MKRHIFSPHWTLESPPVLDLVTGFQVSVAGLGEGAWQGLGKVVFSQKPEPLGADSVAGLTIELQLCGHLVKEIIAAPGIC